MIIDCHCHAGKGDLFTGSWNTDALLVSYHSLTLLNDGMVSFDLSGSVYGTLTPDNRRL